MKTKSILIVLFLLAYSCKFYPQQYSIGPLLNNFRTSLFKTGSNGATTSMGLLPANQMTAVGKMTGTCYRALYQWDIPDNVIPDNVTIDSVRIKYIYSKVSGSFDLSAQFFRIPADISLSNANWANIWNLFTNENMILEKSDLLPGEFGSIPSPPSYIYNDMPKLCDAVKKSLPENRFVLGIMSGAENVYEDRYFYIGTGYVEIKIYYKLPHQSVTVMQILSTGAGYGNVGHYEGNSFIDRVTGTTYSFEVGATEYLRADTNKATVADEKFNKWNDFEKVINHNAFQIDSTTKLIVSRFSQIGTATIKNALEGVSSVTGDVISFKDPWLRDDYSDPKGLKNRGTGAIWHSYSSPFTQDIGSTKFKGVLLNQSRNNLNHYSVLAKPTFDASMPQTGKTHKFYFQNWTASNATISYPMVTETPVVFTANNSEVLANYKGTQLSNTQAAFSNSSQRKFIMIPQTNHPYGGDLHLVYESMGKIWYERSVNGGATWTIENNGKPLNTDYIFTSGGQYMGTGSYTVAKHPSIDYYQNKIIIVWQEQSGSNYVVRLTALENGQRKVTANCIPFQSYGLYSEDIWPEIAVKDGGKAVIAIRRNDPYMKGLEVHYLTLYPEGGTAQEETSGWIPGSDQNTGPFSLAADRNYTDKYHIAWQQNGTSTSSIQYAKFNFIWLQGEEPNDGFYAMNLLKSVNVSNSTNYNSCYSPSMIGVSDGTARLVFKGYRQYYSPCLSSVCPDNLSWIPYLNKYGGEVFSPQISQGSQTYFVGWTEFYNGSFRTIATDASTLSNKETLEGSSGRDMQINNGGTKLQQLSIGFNSEAASLPYSFKPTGAIGDIQVNKKAPVLSGRGIFLTKDDLQMYFILGNVTSGGMNISFINVKDTIRLDGSLKKVNSCLITEPFSLKDNSSLTFAVNYGFRDSSASKSLMKSGDAASFKVEMIDDASGRVLGTYLDVRMDKENIFNSKEGIFRIGSDGIVNKLVRLRILVDENMKSQYTIAEMLLDEGLPLSKSLKEVELNGSSEVKEYSLSQNYPNPFNPTTVISYALPKASKVSLKIYDILGKEVAALVNGYMEIGKYSVEFNASNLPSGIYIYEIRANDFVKSGKMMLLK